jgi:sugar (pentulose or hexulose) kinase
MDDDDLYNDLESSTAKEVVVSASASTLTSNVSISSMQHDLVSVREQNGTLRRNISSLYRTAKVELARKDAEIASLRQQMQQMQSEKPQFRPPPLR